MRKIKLFLIVGFCFLIPTIIIKLMDNYFSERADTYLYQKVNYVSSNVFAQTIREDSFQIPTSELITYQYDNNDKVTSILINSNMVNKILANTSAKVSSIIANKEIEEAIKTIEIPLGTILFTTIFTTMGPNIKINTLPIEAYKVDIVTSNSPYGINNTLLEIDLVIEISIETLTPLKRNNFTCVTNIKLLSQIIQGNIPQYYFSGAGIIPYPSVN